MTLKTFVKQKLYNTEIRNHLYLDKIVRINNILEDKNPHNISMTDGKCQESPAVTSYKRDMAIEKILDDGNYSFHKSLLIVNPFNASLLSAVLIFNTETECKTSYTIIGRKGSANYTKCDENITTRHRLPILGLYENCINRVEINLLDEKNNILDTTYICIKTPKLKAPMHGCVKLTKSIDQLAADFIIASGGYTCGVYAFDPQGNIRFALSRIPQYYGIHLFDDGKFLFPELNQRRPAYGNAHSVVIQEMDMLGRVHHTYLHEKGFHHWAIEKKPGGNILTLTSSMKDTYMENAIVEIDREKSSNVMIFTVDEKNGTFRQEKIFPTPLSVTRSNSVYNHNTGRLMAMCANLNPPVDNYKAKIYEFDYSTGNCINEFSFKEKFFSAHPFDFNIQSMANPLVNTKLFLGHLYEAHRENSLPPELKNPQKRINSCLLLKMRVMGYILQIQAKDHDLEKIYVYNDKNVYVQDFTDTEQPLPLFKTQKYFMSMSLNKMEPGRYKVAVRYLGKTYKMSDKLNIS